MSKQCPSPSSIKPVLTADQGLCIYGTVHWLCKTYSNYLYDKFTRYSDGRAILDGGVDFSMYLQLMIK